MLLLQVDYEVTAKQEDVIRMYIRRIYACVCLYGCALDYVCMHICVPVCLRSEYILVNYLLNGIYGYS